MRDSHHTTMGLAVMALVAGLGLGACDDAADEGGPTPEPARAAYLIANGTWALEDDGSSAADPRDVGLLVMTTPETPGSPSTFSFYGDAAGTEALAEGCGYQYNRSQPDSVMFPARKAAIWVVFDRIPGVGPAACDAYARVALSPTADGEGLHARYGDIDYDVLVGPTLSDPASSTAWWNAYRPLEGGRDVLPFPYIVANGVRVADPEDADTLADPRNPSRVEMTTSQDANSESRFVFYDNVLPDVVVADCNFQVRYTMPDPLAFPADKGALWDAFEMTSANAGACGDFERVVMLWPADGQVMNMRYGGDVAWEELLTMSLDDAPWWATYCRPDAAGCSSLRPF